MDGFVMTASGGYLKIFLSDRGEGHIYRAMSSLVIFSFSN